MEIIEVIDLARDALWTACLISAPVLGLALLSGLLIGIVQSATSINEMTLSFVPKLAVLVLTLAVFGGWQISVLVDFTRRIFERIPALFQ